MYLLAVICLALPFVSVSCGGRKVGSATGIQAVVGYQIADRGVRSLDRVTGAQVPTEIPGDGFLTVAALLAVTAAGLAVLRDRFTRLVRTAAGFVIVGLLVLFLVDFSNQVTKTSRGVVTANADIGYWAVLGCAVIGAGCAGVETKVAR